MSAPDLNTAQAEGWRPEPGDVLVGTIEDIDIGWSDFRGDYPILTIVAADGTKSAKETGVKPGESVKVHCFHDVLLSRVLTLRPVPGETVGLQFHGKEPHKTKPKQTVSRYTFKIQGRGADAAALYDRMGDARRTPQRTQEARAAQMPADSGDFTQGSLTHDDDDIPF